MGSFISCGYIDKKNIIYPIISSSLLIVHNYILSFTNFYSHIIKHLFILIISKSFGKSLAFIPFLFKMRYEKINEERKIMDKNKNFLKKEYIEQIKNIQFNKYYFLLLTALLNFVYKVLYFYVQFEFVGLWIFDIIYISLLSYYFLQIKLYRHQFFSIIINIILGIILNIVNLFDENENYFNIIFPAFAEIGSSFNIVINKYLMEYLFCSAYEICFWEGIFCIFLSIIGLSIFTNIEIEKGLIDYKGKNYLDNIFDYFDGINTKEILVFFLISITHLIIYLFLLISIDKCTIFHIFIIYFFDECDFYLYVLKDWKIYINILLNIVFLFMILVFNEIIILNFCGLQKDVKRNISERALTESVIKSEIMETENAYNGKNSFEENNNSIEIDRFIFNIPNSEDINGSE